MPVSKPRVRKVRCDGCSDLFKPDDLYEVVVHQSRTDTNCLQCAKRYYVIAVEEDADTAVEVMRQARIQRLDDRIDSAEVVRYKDTEVRNGKLRRVKRKAWAGYVLVKMLADGDTIHLIQNCRGVFGLLPLKPQLKGYRYAKSEPKAARPVRKLDIEAHETWYPQPLESHEAARALLMMDAVKQPDPEPTEYEVGDKVVVGGTETMFEGQTGQVTKVFGDQEYLVEFRVLGVPTAVRYNYIDLTLEEELA